MRRRVHNLVGRMHDRIAGHLGQQPLNAFPQARHRRGQLWRPRRCLAQPERDAGRLTLCVLDPHPARLDAQDPVRGIAELEDVALQALDGEVLVESADKGAGRLEDDLIVGVVGDRAAAGDGGQSRATPGAQPVIHRIAMQIRGAPSAPCADALGEHPHDVVEVLALEAPVRPCARDEREELVLPVFSRRHLGHDLLRQHVERMRGNAQSIELAATHRIEERHRFDQLVAARGKQPALRHAADRVVGATDPLQKHRDGARRAQLADELNVADVDSQLERSGGDHRLELARLEALLRVEALLLREAAVVRRDVFLTDALGEVARDALHHPSRIGKDERRVVLRDERGKLIVDGGPDLAGHHRLERRTRHDEGEVPLAHVTDVDDLAGGARPGAGEEARDLLDRLLRRREPDALDRLPGERVQALEGQSQVRTPLGARDRVNFVDDQRASARQHPAAGFAREQQVQGLRRGHEDVRRKPAHRGALRLGGVASPDLRTDLEGRHTEPRQLCAYPRQRLLEIALDVVGQRLERRHVHDACRILEPPLDAFVHERVDRRQKRGQRLARPGRRGD